jgi:7-cyano-7-deazaguanine synthase
MTEKRAVVLLSGGLDSATTLAIANSEGYLIYALTFNYGQRHLRELISAKDIAKYYEVERHEILKLDLSKISRSALTNQTTPIPENRAMPDITSEIPITYVPARNIIMLSYGLAWAESIDAQVIFIGVNAIDYSGYPDCRPEFITAYENAAALGTKIGVEGKAIKIKNPLIDLSKADIIKKGQKLGVPYNLTWSCYQGGGEACGKCDSCLLRLKGFSEAGIKDPIEYMDD